MIKCSWTTIERLSSSALWLYTVELSWSRVDVLRMNGHRNHRAWAQLRCQITELSVNQNSPLIVDAQKRKSDNWISAAYRSGYTYINARIMRRLIIIQLSSIILPSYEGVCWLPIENFRTETGPFYLKWNNGVWLFYIR